MKKIFISICLILFTYCSVFTQQGVTPANGAESLSLGGAVANSTGVSSLLNNQAGLTSINSLAVILNTEQRFLISDIVIASLGVAFKLDGFGTIGLISSNFGFEEFREQKFGLAYARKLNQKLSIGGQLDVLQTRISGFGSNSVITFELGAAVDVNDALNVGVHLFSPGNVTLSNEDEIPTRLALGLKYKISPKTYVLAEMQKILDEDFSLRGGISYELVENLHIRAGATSNPVRLSFGLAYAFGNSMDFSAALTNHETLGMTPAASISYEK